MRCTKILSREDGISYFEDFTIPLSNAGDIGFLSEKYPVRHILFRETDGNYHYQWHNAPNKQFIIIQEGAVEIEVGTGEIRIFRTGDILLVEDTTGQGHISKAVDGQPRKSIFVIID